MLSFGGICGKLETLMYAVPSMVLMIYAWHKINCRHMLLFIGTMVFFEILWDCFAVSWIYHYKSWAPGWIYITWDQNGIAHFSSVFLDPAKHRWAWIFNNPVDITPWYGITGSSFIYMAINSVDIFLVRRNMPSNLDFYQTLYENSFLRYAAARQNIYAKIYWNGLPCHLLIIAQITSVGAWKVSQDGTGNIFFQFLLSALSRDGSGVFILKNMIPVFRDGCFALEHYQY